MADLSISAASVLASTAATIRTGTSGGTLTAGVSVYLDSATNTYKLADANTLAPSKVRGIALNAASSGQPVSICESDSEFTVGATVAVGAVYCVSPNAAGGICLVSDAGFATGDFVSIIGIGMSTTKIRMQCGSNLYHCAQVAKA